MPNRIHAPRARRFQKREGVALIIVLAFVVIITGVIIAYFSRSLANRQISNSSASETKVSLFAQGAADTIIGNLQQEIALTSSATTITSGSTSTVTTVIYTPLTAASMLPQLSGTLASGITSWAPNFLIRSANGQAFYTGTNYTGTVVTIPGNAVAVSSTIPSLNGRYISMARWNSHYLLPLPSNAVNSTPVTSGTYAFAPPDWIMVASSGTSPVISSFTGSAAQYLASGTNPVVGRYSYAVYHEGGLLDANVAGFPSTSGTSQFVYKPGESYADLTKLGLSGSQSDAIVGWRNYASTQAPGTCLSPLFTNVSGSNYYNYVLSNSSGFLRVSGTALNNNGNQSDRMFSSRQELIKFVQKGLGLSGTSLNVLNYLTTFSRDLNQPSYVPAVQSNPSSAPTVLPLSKGGNSAFGGDTQINPSFLSVRVQSAFTRNDGSTANVGDPLVNKRFALQRLAWITYKGPSADVIQTSGTSDPSIQALLSDGIPYSYLLQGTDLNVKNYLGLVWTNTVWNYNVHNGSGTGKGLIMPLGQITSRDPDFFELLKAGITVGSLGKAIATSNTSGVAPTGYATAEVPVNFRYSFDSSVDYHVIQIGANILSEVNPTSYPVRITFDDGTGARPNWEFQGVTDLPYLNYVFNGVLRTQAPAPAASSNWADSSPFQYPVAANGATLTGSGGAYMIQVPAVWNPYDPNGTPGVLRPSQFRIVIDSNDPVALSGTGLDLAIWHGAVASTATTGPTGNNAGLGPPNPIYSWTVPGPGNTTEKPGTNGTIVNDTVTFNDNNGGLYREPTLIFSGTAPGNATRVNGNITGMDANPLPGESEGSMGPWAPLVLGRFPLAFASGTTATYYTGNGLIGVASGNGDNRVYFTYRIQYQDLSGNWVTYDTKYGRTTDGMFSFQIRNTSSPDVTKGPNQFNPLSWASAIDPRTARFGFITDTVNPGRSGLTATACDPPWVGWIYSSSAASPTLGITYPIRQDNSGGFHFVNLDVNNTPPGAPNGDASFGLLALPSTQDIPYPSFSAGWTCPLMPINVHSGPSDVWMFAPGLYSQNNPSTPFYEVNGAQPSGPVIEPSYYADPDGVVRRAAGAYVAFGGTASATTTVGLPPPSIQGYPGAPQTSSTTTPATATPFTQSQSRPLLLHRPFRSVAELGYVFRDVPWKNLDFFTPESGDAGLLDIFCINETTDPSGLVAGKVNLNTSQAPVLTAIISGAYVDDPKITNATVGSISPSLSSTISSALVARTSGANYGPLENLSDLLGRWKSAVAATSGTAYAPTYPGANQGSDLPLGSFPGGGYADGKVSYVGFSGAPSVTGTVDNLTDAYFSALSGTNSSLQTSMSGVKRFREAPIRALANAGQTRVWNLMIDVVAQTGRYPQSASAPSQFMVEGEQRYWVHVAIDRYTGEVIDKQIELVRE